MWSWRDGSETDNTGVLLKNWNSIPSTHIGAHNRLYANSSRSDSLRDIHASQNQCTMWKTYAFKLMKTLRTPIWGTVLATMLEINTDFPP